MKKLTLILISILIIASCTSDMKELPVPEPGVFSRPVEFVLHIPDKPIYALESVPLSFDWYAVSKAGAAPDGFRWGTDYESLYQQYDQVFLTDLQTGIVKPLLVVNYKDENTVGGITLNTHFPFTPLNPGMYKLVITAYKNGVEQLRKDIELDVKPKQGADFLTSTWSRLSKNFYQISLVSDIEGEQYYLRRGDDASAPSLMLLHAAYGAKITEVETHKEVSKEKLKELVEVYHGEASQNMSAEALKAYYQKHYASYSNYNEAFVPVELWKTDKSIIMLFDNEDYKTPFENLVLDRYMYTLYPTSLVWAIPNVAK